jgi:hypothetical protein
LTHSELIFVQRDRDLISVSTCRYPVFPEQLVEEAVFFPIVFSSSVESQMALAIWLALWTQLWVFYFSSSSVFETLKLLVKPRIVSFVIFHLLSFLPFVSMLFIPTILLWPRFQFNIFISYFKSVIKPICLFLIIIQCLHHFCQICCNIFVLHN